MSSRGFTFPPPPPPPPPAPFDPTTSSDGLPMDWRGRGRGRGRGGFGGRGHQGNRPNFSRGGGTPGHNPNFRSRGTGASRGNWSQDRQGRGNFQDGAGRGQKRRHDQAFNKPPQLPDRPVPPPQVPNFGFDLRSIVPPPKSVPQKPQQPPKRNLFGLAPSVDDHESEVDGDEEANMAKAQQANGSSIHISGEGIQMSLNTPEEIAAWIAERKRNRPTRAKAEAAAAKAKEEAEKRAQEKAAKAKERQAAAKEKSDRRKKSRKQGKTEPTISTPTEAQTLQAELEKARQRIAELEKLQKVSKPAERGSKAEAAKKPVSNVHKSKDMMTAEMLKQKDTLLSDDLDQLMASSSDDDGGEHTVSDAENNEDTSPSGTSSEDETSDDDDDDAAPPELSSKDADMQKAHVRKELRKCTNFARTGRCPRGRKCPFKHEPTTSNIKARAALSSTAPRRGVVQGKSLYQRLQEQQEDTLDDLVMQHILYLGDNGCLDTPSDEKVA